MVVAELLKVSKARVLISRINTVIWKKNLNASTFFIKQWLNPKGIRIMWFFETDMATRAFNLVVIFGQPQNRIRIRNVEAFMRKRRSGIDDDAIRNPVYGRCEK